MKRIFKYDISQAFIGTQIIQMPYTAKVLMTQMQGDTPMMWCEIDDESTKVSRSFLIYSTGSIPDGEHVGSFLMDNGALVWHVYETNR